MSQIIIDPRKDSKEHGWPKQLRFGWLTGGTVIGILASGLFIPAVHSGVPHIYVTDDVILTMVYTIGGAFIGGVIDAIKHPQPGGIRLQFGIKHMLAYMYIVGWLIYIFLGFVQIYRVRHGL